MLRAVFNRLPRPIREAIWTARRGAAPVIAPAVRRYCMGRGLEIGAGKTPYCDRKRTEFLDKNVGDKNSTPGANIIAEADRIPRPDAAYSYVFASHVLEHVQDTILTLNEWIRVLKPGGTLFVVLPHAERTIDRFRQVTPLEHHLAGCKPSDHFEEMKAGWLKLPAAERDEEQYRAEWGAEMWDWNFRVKHSVLHYHVWTQNEVARLFQHLGLEIRLVADIAPERPDSFVVVATKP